MLRRLNETGILVLHQTDSAPEKLSAGTNLHQVWK